MLPRLISVCGRTSQTFRPSVSCFFNRVENRLNFATKSSKNVILNDEIRAATLQIVNEKGKLNTVSRAAALNIAERKNLDLVQIVAKGKEGVPVVKLMDYNRELYQRKKKTKEKTKAKVELKEKTIQFGVNIDSHDMAVKVSRAQKFLSKDHPLTVSLKWTRFFAHDKAIVIVNEIVEQILHLEETTIGQTSSSPKIGGQQITMKISPMNS